MNSPIIFFQEGSILPSASLAPSAGTQIPADTASGMPIGTGESTGSSPGGLSQMMLPLAILFGFMWLFVIRPERKRQKQRAAMLSSIGKGDKVVTLGGLHGEVLRLDENTITLRVAEGVKMKFDRSAVNRQASTKAEDAPAEALASTSN